MPSIASALSLQVAARQDRDRRQPRETSRCDVDAVLLAPPLASACECREAGSRGAGREHTAPGGGQAEQLLEPGERDRLQPDSERARAPGACVLVDQAREPVGGERGGGAAA